jgi:hypothetical protein
LPASPETVSFRYSERAALGIDDSRRTGGGIAWHHREAADLPWLTRGAVDRVRSMVPERVTISIISAAGEDAPLTVDDATRQILDFFEMLTAAGGEEGKLISWQLVSVSMQSPLSVTAEPFSDVPGTPGNEIARREKASLAASLEELTTRRRVPTSMPRPARQRAKSFFERNTKRIGRTDIKFDEHSPPLIIQERTALAATSALEAAAADEAAPPSLDLTRTEVGSVEGYVIEAARFYGRPAARIRERITGAEVVCIMSDELAERIGPEHNWRDVWQGRRVLVSGEISYRHDGTIVRIRASDMVTVDAPQLDYSDIADPNFTGGLSPADYLRTIWEEEIG